MDIQIGSDSQTVRMRNMEIGQFGSPTVTISELGVITAKNLYIQGNITSNNANKEIFADVTKDIFIGGAGSRVKVQNLQVGPENSGVTFTSDGTTTIRGTTTVAGNVEVTDGNIHLGGNITCKDGTCGTSRGVFTDLVGTSVTIGGETTSVEIPGSLEIGGGYSSNGVTLKDGNIKLHGNIQLSGNIAAVPGTEATDREIFKDVTGNIRLGADSSEVSVGNLLIQRKIRLEASNDCNSIMVEVDSPKDPCPGVHGDIKYIRNTHTSETKSIFDIDVPPGNVFEVMYLNIPGNPKWYIVGSG
jgi:hypothetical protein